MLGKFTTTRTSQPPCDIQVTERDNLTSYNLRLHLCLEASKKRKRKMGVRGEKGVVWLSKVIVAMTVIASGSGWLAEGQPEAKFKCSGEATCHGLADYKNSNATTLRHIQTLFNVKHLLDIVGANNLPSNTLGNYTVVPNQVVKVPFPCKCGNNTGLSNGVPRYKIKEGDTLSGIADTVFAGLMKYQQIQVANKLPDANNITAGDTLWIPLPCSCDQVGSSSVVHYAHLVESGSSIEALAQQYSTTQQILLSLNGIDDPKSLQAGQVLDVPLRACSSSVKNDSLDFPLLVPNATYTYTANECVKCKCDSSNDYTLQCEPSQRNPTNWSVCPSMECSKNIFIGTTTSTGSCNSKICDYNGYSSRNISVSLRTDDSCEPPDASGASRSTLQVLLCSNLFTVIHFILFLLYVL
ncbi:hypothetical protein VNO77_01547 [Canavalia gladiata]|uniref:LysM domain-containing protein n=1 Tax=Canavalia gladiata TaxID=3824 RepID=A0AAN9R5C1_CANGL